MNKVQTIKRLCGSYINNAGMIGALYVIVPVLIWFGWVLVAVPFRPVYLLRLAVCIIVGGAVGAFLNRRGISLWMIKHRSPKGPATPVDGALIGGGTGFGCCLLPALTSFILTSDPENAQRFVMAAWGGAALLGGLVGLVLGAIGRRYVDREWP